MLVVQNSPVYCRINDAGGVDWVFSKKWAQHRSQNTNHSIVVEHILQCSSSYHQQSLLYSNVYSYNLWSLTRIEKLKQYNTLLFSGRGTRVKMHEVKMTICAQKKAISTQMINVINARRPDNRQHQNNRAPNLKQLFCMIRAGLAPRSNIHSNNLIYNIYTPAWHIRIYNVFNSENSDKLD